MAARYVLLGLARPRTEWFHQVGRWATAAAIPAEFVRCVSVEELRARLAAGRPHSALLADGALPALDRDVVELARQAGAAVLVVDGGRASRNWLDLGAAAVLAPTFSREVLVDALAAHAIPVGRGEVVLDDRGAGEPDVEPGRAEVVAVCGPGGAGSSTVAAALAQGLARRRPPQPDRGPDRAAASPSGVLLADLALNGEQAMLHDVGDVVPGVQELVESHRADRPPADEVRALTFAVVERKYHLLLGLRRARYWATVRARAFEAAFDSLRRSFGMVVCDITADFEGEDEGGSADVEDRNLMARTAALAADVVLAVGRPGAKGVHALVRTLADLGALGVPSHRVLPVFNQAPRSPRARAELAAAVAGLAVPAMGGHVGPAVFLPDRKVEQAWRDAVALPAPLPATLAGAVFALMARSRPTPEVASRVPQLVVPGSLGLGSGREATT